MAHLLLGRCNVAMHQMQDFTTRIQNWEQDVIGTPSAPDFHGVYLERDNPSTVVIELRFPSRERRPTPVSPTGHIERLRREVMECTTDGCRLRSLATTSTTARR